MRRATSLFVLLLLGGATVAHGGDGQPLGDEAAPVAGIPEDGWVSPGEIVVHDLTTVLQGFMPDLKGGETPVGLDFIAPRGDERGSGSASTAASPRSAWTSR